MQRNNNATEESPRLRLRRQILQIINTDVDIKLVQEKWRERNKKTDTLPMFLLPSHEDMINAFKEIDQGLVQAQQKSDCIILAREEFIKQVIKFRNKNRIKMQEKKEFQLLQKSLIYLLFFLRQISYWFKNCQVGIMNCYEKVLLHITATVI